MNDKSNTNELLETWAQVFIWCFVVGVISSILYFILLLLMEPFAYTMYSSIHPVSKEVYDGLRFGALGMMKLITFMFFLVPYIGIRITLARRAS